MYTQRSLGNDGTYHLVWPFLPSGKQSHFLKQTKGKKHAPSFNWFIPSFSNQDHVFLMVFREWLDGIMHVYARMWHTRNIKTDCRIWFYDYTLPFSNETLENEWLFSIIRGYIQRNPQFPEWHTWWCVVVNIMCWVSATWQCRLNKCFSLDLRWKDLTSEEKRIDECCIRGVHSRIKMPCSFMF